MGATGIVACTAAALADKACGAEDKKKLATITMDEVFEKEPELKKEVDERIRNDQWF